MQFFPVEASAQSTASIVAANSASSQNSTGEGGGFNELLSSFIEDERYDYSGRPAGFSAFAQDAGTISSDTATDFAKALRARGVDEQSVKRFEEFAASGSPMTVASAFRVLSGKGRTTEALEGEEREAFKALLGKLGLSREEQEELLGLSDEGNSDALLKRLAKAMKEKGEALEMSLSEANTLLKALDLDAESRKTLLSAFAANAEISLDYDKVSSLLSGVNGELASRSTADQYAATQMRDAMNEALKAKKNAENNGQVDNNRGSRRAEQSEALMQNSVRKNTGIDDLKDDADQNGEDESGRQDGKSRSERILAVNSDAETAKSGKGKETRAGAADRFTQRIELAADYTVSAPQSSSQGPSANLNTLASQHRQEIFSQVENGLLQSMRGGGQRLTLQLNPAELGQVTVILSVHQNEVRASIRAENPESAEILSQQLTELKASLEAQGLKVKELDVQSNLSDNAFAGNWDGHQEHNLMRDTSERDRIIRLARLRRDSAQGSEATIEQAQSPAHQAGLHVVA